MMSFSDERVDHRHANTVQTTGHLVTLAAELAAGMQHREHHFCSRLTLVLTLSIRIDRNAAPIVVDTTTAVGQQCHHDAIAEAGHGLVDGVVDHFPDEVMETLQTGGTDVHTRALAYRVEPLQDLNVFGAIAGSGLLLGSHALPRKFSVELAMKSAASDWGRNGEATTNRMPVIVPAGCNGVGFIDR